MATETVAGGDADIVATEYRIFPTGWHACPSALEDRWSVTVQRFPSGQWMIRRGALHWSPSASDGGGAWRETTFYGKPPRPDAWFSLQDAIATARHLADTRKAGPRRRTFAEVLADNA
jgi:hypothetical protein